MGGKVIFMPPCSFVWRISNDIYAEGHIKVTLPPMARLEAEEVLQIDRRAYDYFRDAGALGDDLHAVRRRTKTL